MISPMDRDLILDAAETRRRLVDTTIGQIAKVLQCIDQLQYTLYSLAAAAACCSHILLLRSPPLCFRMAQHSASASAV